MKRTIQDDVQVYSRNLNLRKQKKIFSFKSKILAINIKNHCENPNSPIIFTLLEDHTIEIKLNIMNNIYSALMEFAFYRAIENMCKYLKFRKKVNKKKKKKITHF